MKDDLKVTDIILTHWHHDHVLGLAPVLSLLASSSTTSAPPRIHKIPAPDHDESILNALNEIPPEHFTGASSGALHDLSREQSFPLEDGAALKVIHVPGHSTDSIALLYTSPTSLNAGPPVLLTADTVLGAGTAVFENLKTYLDSLQRLVDELEDKEATVLYPGHGDVVKNGRAKLKEYIQHRQDRENQVVEALGARVRDG